MRLLERKAREYLIKQAINQIEKNLLSLNDKTNIFINVLNSGLILKVNSASRYLLRHAKSILEKELKTLRKK